ncbi:MAG: S8 family serine peptidase, partial [Vicinamibacterales bacterium]
MVLALAASGAAAPGGNGKSKGKSGLSKHDRELLAEARANGESSVTILIAANDGSNQAAVTDVERLGGTIEFRNDELGYVRASIPVDSVEDAAKLSSVEALDIDEVIPLDDPRPDGAVVPTPQTPPGAGTPNNNPYMPIGDTGASQFMAANPTWDGRGVTVGILDTGITLDHPSLLTTSTGERKIVDWVTYTDPFTDDDPTWVSMADQVSGASFTYKGVTYT